MTAFGFEPHALRKAVAAIRADLPGTTRPPSGLAALFAALGQVPLANVIDWGSRLGHKDLDLLCRYLDRAPTTRVLCALFLILGSRGDTRSGGVLQRFFFSEPAADELTHLQTVWSDLGAEAAAGRKVAWISRFFAEAGTKEPLDHAKAAIDRGLTLDRVFNEHTHRLPLTEPLTEYVFAQGGELLRSLPPETASELAAAFLEQGNDRMVQTFLIGCPVDHWKPGFLERVYTTHGNPDPARNAFYRIFHTDRLWAIRKRLFEGRMSPLVTDGIRHAFWSEWLHYCQDWRLGKGRLTAQIKPFRVIEDEQQTRVYAFGEGGSLVAEVPRDHRWEAKMTELFAEVRLLA